MKISRRVALGRLGGGFASIAGGERLFAESERLAGQKLCYFTKMFQGLTYEELAKLTAELGFDGVEATIRPKGHIEPEAVPEELPKMVAAMKEQGREVTIMASGINAISEEQHTESVLRTAVELGIRHYRMAYYKYAKDRSQEEQLPEFRAKLKDLAALNQELGIQALYQNHAGSTNVGAQVSDICELVAELPREAVSLAFDIRHAVAERGDDWAAAAQEAMPLSRSVYVKDCVRGNGEKLENVPLGEGLVDPTFFPQFQVGSFPGPISLHVEYIRRDDPDAVQKGKAAYVTDFATLKGYLAG
ncbi:MAG: sugar phosphate isomerase/epimerase family protein [Verrucomicrobiota bacterium]